MKPARLTAFVLATTLLAGGVIAGGAEAQGLFDFFRPFFSPPARNAPPGIGYEGQASPRVDTTPQVSSRRRARNMEEPARIFSEGGTSYCVRLCDGRFFPISESGRSSPAKICSAMCPATATKIYSGREIDDAVASDGKRYADLGKAFLYRQKVLDGCTCNGKDAFGLAKIDVAKDPTLRAGDLVATSDGMKMFRGSSADTYKASDFTPVDKLGGARRERGRVPSIRVTPRSN